MLLLLYKIRKKKEINLEEKKKKNNKPNNKVHYCYISCCLLIIFKKSLATISLACVCVISRLLVRKGGGEENPKKIKADRYWNMMSRCTFVVSWRISYYILQMLIKETISSASFFAEIRQEVEKKRKPVMKCVIIIFPWELHTHIVAKYFCRGSGWTAFERDPVQKKNI